MTYVSTVLADGAVGFWELGEASGATATDAVGNQNGTYSGTVSYGLTGTPGGGGATAVSLAAAQVAIPDKAAQRTTDIFTFEVWVRRTAISSVQAIFGGPTIGDPAMVFTADNFVQVGRNNVGPKISISARRLTDVNGEFHHIVWTKNGSASRIYLDGTDTTTFISNQACTTTAAGFDISTTVGGFGLQGVVGMVALYTTALTPTQVLNHYVIGSDGIPFNIGQPLITGTGSAIGKVLSCSTGAWTNTPSAYAYQWKRNGTNLGGATSATYTTVSGDSGQTLSCAVTATGTGGPGEAGLSTPPIIPGPYWNPTLQQYAEADTIWLMDMAVEAAIPQTAGGLIDAGGYDTSDVTLSDPFRAGSPYVVGPGKYTDGIAGSPNLDQWLFMPGQMISPQGFTVEFNIVSTSDWAAAGGVLLAIGNSAFIQVATFGGSPFPATNGVALTFGNSQVYPAITGTIAENVAHLANEDVSIAITYDGTTLTLIVNGAAVGTAAFPQPATWAADERNDGINILSGNVHGGGGQSSTFTISDLRISRAYRPLGSPITIPAATNSVTITDTVESTLPTDFRAGLHDFATSSATVGNATIEALNQGYPNLARTDKFLSAIPIKAGSPDATHLSLGHSGLYSYNWGPVDNSLNYYKRLGLRPYLCFDSCPQLLGGNAAPFSAVDCANPAKLVAFGSFNNQIPNDYTAFATICADLYYYVTYTRQDPVAYWTFWNEANVGGPFWPGTDLQMFQLYAAVRAKLEAINPNVVVGAVEGWFTLTTPAAFFAYCAANNVKCDIMPTHFYSGDFGYLYQWARTIAAQAAANGMPAPAIVSGETGWNSANNPGHSQPFSGYNFLINGWAAAFYASVLIHAHRAGYKAMVFTSLGTHESTDVDYAGALTSATKPWAIRNLFEMWQRIGG